MMTSIIFHMIREERMNLLNKLFRKKRERTVITTRTLGKYILETRTIPVPIYTESRLEKKMRKKTQKQIEKNFER